MVERGYGVNEENKAAVDKMIALMEESVKQSDPRAETNVWDWYAGHALGGVMASMPGLAGHRAAEYAVDAVNAIMRLRPKG